MIISFHCVSWSVFSQAQSLRQQAEAKYGQDSQIWFAEPVDTGPNRWDPPSITSDFGVVLEWNSQKLVLVRPGAEKETTIPGDYVTKIAPNWSDTDAAKIHSSFVNRKFQEVISKGSEVLKKPTLPRWQQRILLAEIVQSLSASGRYPIASKVFVTLARENAPQLLLSSIPIPWGNGELDENAGTIQPLAEEWLLDPNEAVQLLGAAWLLSGPKRGLAKETLESLDKKSSIPIVSAYARIQLWRIVPPTEIVSDRIPSWIDERDKLMLPLQAGPTCLLANRLAQAGQPALALPQWLRIASQHSDRYDLARDSVNKSVVALRSMGRIDEAEKIERLGQSLK